MATSSDVGREAVYAAEVAAFEGTSYESLTSLDHLVDLAADITEGEWWPLAPPTVVAARSDARSSTTRQRADDRPVVRLAAPQLTEATLVHELAHVLAGVDRGHSGAFRRAHVDLVSVAFGPEPAAWLADAYAAMGLDVGARHWPEPPPAAGADTPTAL